VNINNTFWFRLIGLSAILSSKKKKRKKKVFEAGQFLIDFSLISAVIFSVCIHSFPKVILNDHLSLKLKKMKIISHKQT